MIFREEILALIPHAGKMCLLDEILEWDANRLSCCSRSFALPNNPMRRGDGTLGMACGIEIAGQAMAAHGRLTAGSNSPPTPGMLVSLRDVECSAGPLDALELLIEVERIMGDAKGAAYQFSITDGDRDLLAGRAMVVF